MTTEVIAIVVPFSNSVSHRACVKILKKEGIECLEGELLLVKLQNASLEALHSKVRCKWGYQSHWVGFSLCG